MGSNITIPAINRGYRIQTIFDPKNDLRDLIESYLGMDCREMFDEILEENEEPKVQGDDYEKIADGLNTQIRDVADSLNKLLGKKHIKKEDIAKIYDDIQRNL